MLKTFAQRYSLPQRLVRHAGMVVLALLMILVSAGIAYVAHLTETTSQKVGDSPSVMPLIVLSILAAIAGVGTLRLAMRDDHDLSA